MLQIGDRIELGEGDVQLRYQTRSVTRARPTFSMPVQKDPVDDLVVDPKSREVRVKGNRLEPPLSRKEFDVLNVLAQRIGEACSKDDIAAVGWPERNAGDIGDQDIEQIIRRLRMRIEPDRFRPHYIITVRGYGYKLAQG